MNSNLKVLSVSMKLEYLRKSIVETDKSAAKNDRLRYTLRFNVSD